MYIESTTKGMIETMETLSVKSNLSYSDFSTLQWGHSVTLKTCVDRVGFKTNSREGLTVSPAEAPPSPIEEFWRNHCGAKATAAAVRKRHSGSCSLEKPPTNPFTARLMERLNLAGDKRIDLSPMKIDWRIFYKFISYSLNNCTFLYDKIE